MAADAHGGYWIASGSGNVATYDGALFLGSPAASNIDLSKPLVGMAGTPDGNGYWLVASDGGIFSYGDAMFYGSTGSIRLNQPIVGMAATPDGNGYWLVASDGGIFSYGDAPFYGSASGGEQVLGIVVTPATGGYVEIGVRGNAYSFGPAAQSAQAGAVAASGTTPSTGSTGPQSGTDITITTPPANIEADPAQPDCEPSTPPTAAPDQGLDNVFAGQLGPGWIGGDATYSTLLPDGRDAFAFSDTLVGTSQPDGAASVTGFTHNSELVGTFPSLSGVFGGTSSSPQSLIPDTGSTNDVWAVSATDVENGNQLIFVNEFAVVPGSFFDTYTGRSAIASLSLPSGGLPVFDELVSVPTDPNTQWGTAIAQNGGYTYIYGSDIDFSTNTFYGMKVARVPLGESLDTAAWTYWNGSQWLAGETNAVPIVTGTVLTGVIQLTNGGFMAVSIPGGVTADTTVDLSFSCNAAGPWSTPQPIYTVPELSEYADEIAYIPTFHPEVTGDGLVVSYNIDTMESLSSLEQNVHAYQPRFLDING